MRSSGIRTAARYTSLLPTRTCRSPTPAPALPTRTCPASSSASTGHPPHEACPARASDWPSWATSRGPTAEPSRYGPDRTGRHSPLHSPRSFIPRSRPPEAARQIMRRISAPRGQPEVAVTVGRLDVDQAVRGHDQVVPELGGQCVLKRELVEGDPHVLQPGVAFGLADGEPDVPHPQPGVPAQLIVGAGTAPVLHEEQHQVFLGRAEVLGRVHRPQHGIFRHALIEPVDQSAEGLLPAYGLAGTRRANTA